MLVLALGLRVPDRARVVAEIEVDLPQSRKRTALFSRRTTCRCSASDPSPPSSPRSSCALADPLRGDARLQAVRLVPIVSGIVVLLTASFGLVDWKA
jgi:hypothetical protein